MQGHVDSERLIAAFRASLVEKKLSEKRINNILAVLSKALKYAVDCELISARAAQTWSPKTKRAAEATL